MGGLCLCYHRPRKLRNNLWAVCVLRVLLCTVLAPMVTRMHRDLRQWNRIQTCLSRRSVCSMNLQRGQGRNQTWITQPSLNVSTVCWVKQTPSFSRARTRQTSSISTRVFDDESCKESESNFVAKEIGVVVADIDQFGPATNRFLESPAANEIAGSLFSEMHVKEQGLVKLRSKFALQGFHNSVSAATQSELSRSGSCGGRATLFRSHLAISHPFGSIQTGAAGFDWSSMTLLLKGTPVMFVSVYLTCNTGIAGEKNSKALRDRLICHECQHPLRHCRRLECATFRIAGINLACPNQRRALAPV